MRNLYLLDKPAGANGLELAKADVTAQIVLIQDGVFLDCSALDRPGVDIYAIRQDVTIRGQAGRLPDSIHVIDYGRLVDLMMASKVINFT